MTVAQELNFTHAAEKLNMSQPPLSNQIKQLEEEFGAQLFIRGKRHLQLTEAGRLLYKRAVQITDLAATTREEVASLASELSGKINLGMVEGRAPYLCARWMNGFREEFPKVHFSLWNGSSDDVLDRLHHGLVDLAIIAAPFDTEALEGIAVGEEPWVAWMSKDHPLAQLPGDTIDIKQLDGVPLIVPERRSRQEAIVRWFSAAGVSPDTFCTLSNFTDAIALAEQNVGVCIFPKTSYTPNSLAVSKIITGPSRKVAYYLVWAKGQRPIETVEEFINYVRDFMDEDRMQQEKYKVQEDVVSIPEDAELL